MATVLLQASETASQLFFLLLSPLRSLLALVNTLCLQAWGPPDPASLTETRLLSSTAWDPPSLFHLRAFARAVPMPRMLLG